MLLSYRCRIVVVCLNDPGSASLSAAVPVPSEAVTEQPACLTDGKVCSGMSDVRFISTLSTFRCFISACLENFSS